MNRCFQFPDGFLVSIYHQISNYHKILPSDKVVPSLNVKIQHIFSFISTQTPLTEDFISVLQNHLHLHFYSARVWSKQLRIVILLVTATGPRLLTCVCVLLDVCCRDEPQSRLSKMGAMPTPFQSAPDDFPPPPPEVEEEPELKDAPGITWRSECSRFEIKSLDLWKSQEKSEILRIILLTAPVALPAPKISVPPKMKALPKVPLKPSAEDLELYGWVRVSGALICLQ